MVSEKSAGIKIYKIKTECDIELLDIEKYGARSSCPVRLPEKMLGYTDVAMKGRNIPSCLIGSPALTPSSVRAAETEGRKP